MEKLQQLLTNKNIVQIIEFIKKTEKRLLGAILLLISLFSWLILGIAIIGIKKILIILVLITLISTTIIGFGLTFCKTLKKSDE